MKIVFIYPSFETHFHRNPILLEYLKLKKESIRVPPPPAGIAILAALTPSNIEVKFIDDRIEQINYKEDVDLIALSFFTPQATRAFEIADEYRKHGKTVIAGGLFPSLMPEETLKHIDSVVIGEGENLWKEVISDFKKKRLRKIYFSRYFVDLDKIPTPKWELYFEKGKKGYTETVGYFIQVVRGCLMNCVHCVIPIYMKRIFRFRKIELVMREMLQLKKDGKPIALPDDSNLFFYDNQTRRYMLQLFSNILTKRIQISVMMTHVDFILRMDNTVLKTFYKMKAALLYLVYTSREMKIILKEGGRADKEKVLDSIKKLQDIGTEPYLAVYVGLDDQDVSVFDRVLDFCNLAGINIAEFSIVTPYPKSPLWRQMIAQNRIIDYEWKHYNDANVVFKPAKMSEEELYRGYLYL